MDFPVPTGIWVAPFVTDGKQYNRAGCVSAPLCKGGGWGSLCPDLCHWPWKTGPPSRLNTGTYLWVHGKKMLVFWEHWSTEWFLCSFVNWISTVTCSVGWGLTKGVKALTAADWLQGQGTEQSSGVWAAVDWRQDGGGCWERLWPKLLIGALYKEQHQSDLSSVLMNVMFETMTCIWTRTKPWKYFHELCFISSTAAGGIQHSQWYHLRRPLAQVLY